MKKCKVDNPIDTLDGSFHDCGEVCEDDSVGASLRFCWTPNTKEWVETYGLQGLISKNKGPENFIPCKLSQIDYNSVQSLKKMDKWSREFQTGRLPGYLGRDRPDLLLQEQVFEIRSRGQPRGRTG